MDKDIFVNCGCFCGNIDEFLLKVFETHGENRYAKAETTSKEKSVDSRSHERFERGGER